MAYPARAVRAVADNRGPLQHTGARSLHTMCCRGRSGSLVDRLAVAPLCLSGVYCSAASYRRGTDALVVAAYTCAQGTALCRFLHCLQQAAYRLLSSDTVSGGLRRHLCPAIFLAFRANTPWCSAQVA